MYKVTSAVIQFGEMKFKQRPREEQAESDGSAGNISCFRSEMKNHMNHISLNTKTFFIAVYSD